MNKTYYLMIITTFLLLFLNGLQAQTSKQKINQVELMKKNVGTWQTDAGNDTLEVWECQQYGMAFLINVYQVINGEKTPLFINNIEFSAQDGKFKGFILRYNGGSSTWIGLFYTENKFNGNFVQKFDPEMINGRFQQLYDTPASFTLTQFDKGGVKVYEKKFAKVK